MPTHFTRKCFYTENVLLNSITVLVAVFFIKLIPQRAFFGNNQENVFQRVYSHSRQLRFTSQFNYFKSSLAAFHIFKHLIGDLNLDLGIILPYYNFIFFAEIILNWRRFLRFGRQHTTWRRTSSFNFSRSDFQYQTYRCCCHIYWWFHCRLHWHQYWTFEKSKHFVLITS